MQLLYVQNSNEQTRKNKQMKMKTFNENMNDFRTNCIIFYFQILSM